MSDLRAPAVSSPDALYQQAVLKAAGACQGWAHARFTGELQVVLYPRDRGPVPRQQPQCIVTQRTIQHGIWRITLCPEGQLPPGVNQRTRDIIIRSETARAWLELDDAAVDQIVQCGLFGEVIYS